MKAFRARFREDVALCIDEGGFSDGSEDGRPVMSFRLTRHAMGAFAVLLSAVAIATCPAAAQAGQEPTQVVYGETAKQFAMLFPGGSAVVLLLHENGWTWRSVRDEAEALQRSGYTVLDLEWNPVSGEQIWGATTAQIETAVRFVRGHAAALHVDPQRLAMVGGSRGANLALLTSLNMNAKETGTVKAVVSLSGDVNPLAEIERIRAAGGETNSVAEEKLTKTYGCEPHLESCPIAYIEEWDPFAKVSATAPAMLLAASELERLTAYYGDQQPMAEALVRVGVKAEAVITRGGHGFDYWSRVRERLLSFLRANDVS